MLFGFWFVNEVLIKLNKKVLHTTNLTIGYKTKSNTITITKNLNINLPSEKLIGLINTKAGGVLGKFEWKNQNTGATLIDVGNPQDFVDDFLALFPDVNGPLFLNPTQPLEQTYQIGSSLTIKFYPVSNTTGGPTLSFIGSPNFKIRFS